VIDVAYWPNPEVSADGKRVRFWGQSGKHLLGLRITGFDPKRRFATVITALQTINLRLTQATFVTERKPLGLPRLCCVMLFLMRCSAKTP
jgi:hypothetical protein